MKIIIESDDKGLLTSVQTDFLDTAEYKALLTKAFALCDGPVDQCSSATEIQIKRPIQNAMAWVEEAMNKYASKSPLTPPGLRLVPAIQWLGRWKVNCQDHPEDLAQLDCAIAFLEAQTPSRVEMDLGGGRFSTLHKGPRVSCDGYKQAYDADPVKDKRPVRVVPEV